VYSLFLRSVHVGPETRRLSPRLRFATPGSTPLIVSRTAMPGPPSPTRSVLTSTSDQKQWPDSPPAFVQTLLVPVSIATSY
jgi:hypothetical protein